MSRVVRCQPAQPGQLDATYRHDPVRVIVAALADTEVLEGERWLETPLSDYATP